MIRSEEVRQPAVAGTFYPAEPEVLTRDVRHMLDSVREKKAPGRIRGIIAPHAGYMYSGPTAACGYSLVAGARISSVVVVSPSHREFFDGVSAFPGSAYQTPLGSIPIDAGLRDDLRKAFPALKVSMAGHGEEHAIEVQLPFLQAVLKEFRLLPLVIGHQSPEICFSLGDALGSVIGSHDVLLVASTDLSHYYPSNVADKLDAVMIEDVRSFDHAKLMADLEAGKTEACGGGPAVAVMVALKRLGVRNMKILHHCTSGDVTGVTHAVVGDLSAVAYS